jgi:hypothetical protein
MTDYQLAKTWFPGVRKELLIFGIQLLQTKAGENRIKLAMTMPLSDGKLVAMPSWLGDSYDVIGKADSLLMSDKWGHEIKEMTWTVFSTEDSQKSSQLAVCPLMNSFQLKRGAQDEDADELSDVCLHFVAYLNDNSALWSWCRVHYRKSIFVKFETTQQELFDQPKQEDTQMKLGDVRLQGLSLF